VVAHPETKTVIIPRLSLPRENRAKVRRDRKALKAPPVREERHKGKVFTVAFSPDGKKVVSGSEDGCVKFWNASTGKVELTLPNQRSRAVTSLRYAAGGRTLALGRDDGVVEVWDLVSRTRTAGFKGASGRVGSLAVSPDGKVVVSARQEGTVEWDDSSTSKGKVRPPFKGQECWPVSTRLERWGRVCCTAFSPNGKHIAWGRTDGGLTVWSLDKREIRGTYAEFQQPVSVVAFTPDGDSLAAGSEDGTVKLWRRCGKEQRTCRGHTGVVRSIAFAQDGKLLATGSDDRTVRIWDAGTGQERALLTGHQGPVLAVAFSPDGRIIASGSSDHTVKLWDPPTDPAARAK
jgi:WD40 repeat protein